MVKKRSLDDRIEKVMRKKRKNIEPSDCCLPSGSQKTKNALNDSILSLYKEEISIDEKSLNTSHPISNEAEMFKEKKNEEFDKCNSAKNSKPIRKPTNILEKKISSGFSIEYPTLSLKDVGGLDKTIKKITEKFFHFVNPGVTSAFGMEKKVSSLGILLHGPPGSGKSFLVKAIAGEMGVPLIEAQELVGGISGESENKIKELFAEAAKNSPCILFIDQIDTIAPKRDTTDRGMERRMVAQLLKSFDELKANTSACVGVIGATTRPDSIDPALRLGGRFDFECAIEIPNENTRLEILQVITKNVKLSPDFDLEWLAHHTPGYLAIDLETLLKEAFTVMQKRMYLEAFDKKSDSDNLLKFEPDTRVKAFSCLAHDMRVSSEEMENVYMELRDFQVALKDTVPFSKREGFAMVPSVSWDDVGALKDVKEEICETIIWPVKYGKFYDMSHVESCKGMLLHGPKGCGKTLLAKAIANECNINFLSVKGPELLNMYLGESERAVRQCFQRARNSAPCVIFFDEMDALCPPRTGSNSNAAAERVVNTLLTEMDGMEDRHQVYVVAATNRIDHIDSAMLRPGRLGAKIYVGLPSPDDRIEILKSITKNKTKPKISDDVDLRTLAFDQRCDNFSGADLADLVRVAAAKAMREHLTLPNCSFDEALVIQSRHFDAAFTKVRPSVTEKDIKYI